MKYILIRMNNMIRFVYFRHSVLKYIG